MRILVVDDHPLYLDGLRSLLQSRFGGVGIYESGSVERAIEIVESNQLDLILVDFRMPDMDGLDFLRAMAARGYQTPVVMISGEVDPKIADQSMNLGASGFIPKFLSTEQFLVAVQVVLGGGKFVTRELKQQIDQLRRAQLANPSPLPTALQGITKRQLDVLKLMAKGYTNKRISNIMNLSVNTVKEHIHNIFLTIDANNRSHCIVRAQELGLDILEQNSDEANRPKATQGQHGC